MIKNKSIVSICLATILLSSTAFSSISFANSSNKVEEFANNIANDISQDTFANLSEESMYLILNAVNDMPQEMLNKGNFDEISKYMRSKGINFVLKDEELLQIQSFWGCVGAITWAVGATALGVGLLAKLKKFIAISGGVKAAATALIAIARQGATIENINRFGSTLVSIGGTILGIKEIKEECF